MMYTSFPYKKIVVLSLLLMVVGGMLWVTFSYKKKMSPEYFSVDGLVLFAKLPIQTLIRRAQFIHKTDHSFSASALIGYVSARDRTDIISASGDAQDIPVLVYHGITDEADRFSMTGDSFADHMMTLKEAGYQTITIDQFLFWMNGEIVLPDKSFLLTFDDGRSDSYYGADPILSALDYSAVMFVATQPSIRTDASLYSYYLHSGLLDKMVSSGRWSIGSHAVQESGGRVAIDEFGTADNFLSNKIWLASDGRLETDEEYYTRLTGEIADSKIEIERALGVPVDSFSYPFGDYGQEAINNEGSEGDIARLVKGSYKAAFRQVWPKTNLFTSNYIHNGDSLYFRRIEPSPLWSGEDLLVVMTNAHAKTIPYEDEFVEDRGWKHAWGTVHVQDGMLLLSPTNISTGALTFLDGTALWEDYAFTVRASRAQEGHISLLARFNSDSNYVACVFADTYESVVSMKNGVFSTLHRHERDVVYGDGEKDLSIVVEGSTVGCYEEGERVIESTYSTDEDASHGGMGIQIWDDVVDNTSLSVSSVSVLSLDTFYSASITR